MDSLPSASEASFLLVENSLPKKGKSVQTKLQISSIDIRFGLKILTALDCKSLTELVLKSFGWVRFIHPIDGLRSESLDGLSGKWNQNTQCSLFSSTSLGLLNLGLLITKSIWENVESFFFVFFVFPVLSGLVERQRRAVFILGRGRIYDFHVTVPLQSHVFQTHSSSQFQSLHFCFVLLFTVDAR